MGLPGSGKTAVGRRLASRHGATFIDLDDEIERASGASVPEIFADEGEAGFRRRERAAVAALGPADAGSALRRVISPGGGAVVDPRNRWSLFRGRRVAWLDVRTEVIAQRLRRSPVARPLVQGPDPLGQVRALAAARERFYAAGIRINGVADLAGVLGQLEALLASPASGATALLHALTPIGEVVLGEGMAVDALDGALRRLRARRAVLVSEPGAWAAAGEGIASGLRGAGWAVEPLMLPPGEDAKRLAVIEDAARALARLRLERGEPLVAIGGGALGDPAGFLAATYARGVPWIQVPTTLVAQVDSSIGGKTAVDLPEGKNLLGAFHHPAAIVLDVALLRTLPERQLRAAMGEIVKMAALGDEALFAAVEADGAAIAHGDSAAFEGGAVAEVVERAAWAKIEVVIADEREQGGATGRVALNLGHTVAHAIEAVDGYATLMHGEAVAYGLRAATRVGTGIGVTPPERAERIERALDRLSLGVEPLPYPPEAVVAATGTDKKRAEGRLRWVLPTADGYVTRDDIPEPPVREVVAGVLAGRGGRAT